ncbi:MAG TPA: CoA transferase, partial [Steroidobacteraceae bacterium]|nr:CoA transferase [Steroidobacteraceae bacterium]
MAWHGLYAAVGRPELAGDSRFADPGSRRRSHGELDLILSEWTREQDAGKATAMLQAAGIAAAPVQHIGEPVNDPLLDARGFWRQVEEPGFGTNPYSALPFQLSRAPLQIKSPLPRFAEHNRTV